MPAAAASDTGVFERHRRELKALAYRMLGSLAEAEDIVQETWLRWRRARQADRDDDIAAPRAFLRRIATRLCLDQLKSARARREAYVGPWLPEPVIDPEAGEVAMTDRDVTMGLMLALERLTPPQRAAFLLHDLFDMPFAEVAEALGQEEATARQHAARGRRLVRAARKRFDADYAEAERLTDAFLKASREGDAGTLKRILADDVVIYADGGGKRPAARNLIRGLDRAVRLLVGLAGKFGGAPAEIAYRGPINAAPGFVTIEADGLPQATVIEAAGGRIRAVYIVRNPEKLRLLPVRGS